ncbi:MAG: CRISPR-associated helicase Cas3' [Lentisphaeria bacterium]
MPALYAHSIAERPLSEWQPLKEHLQNVADKSARFAEDFGAGDWAYIAGLWHDLGKAALPWQAYLRHANNISDEVTQYYKGKVEHAIIAARELYNLNTPAGVLLAYCIAGHHGGLSNWEGDVMVALKSRLTGESEPVEKLNLPSIDPQLHPPFVLNNSRSGFQLQFFTRMLFSCLVDADYLDTEAAVNSGNAQWRNTFPEIAELHSRFKKNFAVLRENADIDLPVNRQREIVLNNCLEKADESPGLFSLSVPTGGGKTLASLAFALKHAEKYGHARVIYVVPFTSIIEQNAAVFREMLGDAAVVEHHCNFIADDTDQQMRLAAENWDAPIVVTTNVQFFDSLYANKTSKCRKLHNIANSIVIFDEVQAIPVDKVKPCLEVTRELSQDYGVTCVLCTATQPAFKKTEEFEMGLEDVREIIEDVPALFSALKRTSEKYVGEIDTEELATRIAENRQALCIVNTRKQALDVFNAVSDLHDSENTFHLSASMYPVHRSRKLAEIRKRLLSGQPCLVVSTQLIEAGVDIDFPVVYRAAAGIDSIAQAAGRCNRNGRNPIPCEVYIFNFPKDRRCSFFRQAAQSAEKLFDKFDGDLTSPDCVEEYFLDYFWKNEHRMDKDDIVKECMKSFNGNIQFADIAGFQMIEAPTIPVVVTVEEESVKLVKSLEYGEGKGGIMRRLQQYTVQIYPFQFEELRGWCEQVMDGIWVLKSETMYNDITGLITEAPDSDAFFS